MKYNMRTEQFHWRSRFCVSISGVSDIKSRPFSSAAKRILIIAIVAATTFSAAPLAEAQRSNEPGLVARGSTRPSQLVLLNAPIEGILKEVPVEEGDDVEADTLLAQMDDSLQQLRVQAAELEANAEARIESARLRLEEAKAILSRTQQAYDRGSAPEWELFRAKLDVRLSESSVNREMEQRAQAESSLELERKTLTRYQLRAPFAGRVLRVDQEPGASMTREDRIIQLAALDELEAVIYVPVEWYGNLTVGSQYELQAGAPVNGQVTGTMKAIDPVLDPGSQTFRCLLIIENDDKALPGGFSIEMKSPKAVSPSADSAAE